MTDKDCFTAYALAENKRNDHKGLARDPVSIRREYLRNWLKGEASEYPVSGDDMFDAGFVQAICWVADLIEEGCFDY